MVDFLKSFPFLTIDDYKWRLSAPMVRIMSADNSHVNYLTEKQVEIRKHKEKNIDFGDANMLNDLGIKMIEA